MKNKNNFKHSVDLSKKDEKNRDREEKLKMAAMESEVSKRL